MMNYHICVQGKNLISYRYLFNCFSRSDSCLVTVGNLPLKSPTPNLVYFKPYLDMFGRPLPPLLESFPIGGSIKLRCLGRGTMFRLDAGEMVEFLLGECIRNVTELGLPGWMWTVVEGEGTGNFSLGPIPECGKCIQ